MKTIYLTILTCLFTTTIFGQVEFEQVGLLPPNPINIGDFHQIKNGSVAFADVDNDNDLDVVIAGTDLAGNWDLSSKLYINDGNGRFLLDQGTNFEGVERGDIAFADVDNDQDQDLLITGAKDGSQRISNLYINDGNGNFTLEPNTPFQGVDNGSIAFTDIDNDNDQDILITGYDGSNRHSKLYTNDGNGNFTLIPGTPFEQVNYSSIAFADIDNDNDQDLLITGNSGAQLISKLYLNDGSGSFSLATNNPFEQVDHSSIAFADIDNDNDQDILISGDNGTQLTSKLYLNDGSGIFSLMSGTAFTGTRNGDIAFADIDNDNDQDVLITGEGNSWPNLAVSEIYTNDGNGVFSLTTSTPLIGVDWSAIAFADIDNDQDQDLLITGGDGNGSSGRVTKLYNNDGNGNFTLVIGSLFQGAKYGKISFADIDSDQDQDVLIAGRLSSSGLNSISNLYENDGNGNFSLIANTPFTGLSGFNSFVDIDGDNDLDMLSCGHITAAQSTSNLYLNDGNGNFSLSTVNLFDNLSVGAVAVADVDNDNDQDVLILGDDALSRLFLNDGSGSFTLSPLTLPFPNLEYSTVTFEDVDNDNDQDVLITGDPGSSYIAELYINDGNGYFTLQSGTPFTGVRTASVVFFDSDNDTDKDVLIVGTIASSGKSKLYINDGTGNFTLKTGTPFSSISQGVLFSSAGTADIDNDGDQDIFISGQYTNSIYPAYLASKVYLNNGNNNFSLANETPFEGLEYGDISFTDIDNDNDQDVLMTGKSMSSSPGEPIAKLYRNTSLQHCPVSSNFTFIDNGNGNYSFTNTSAGNVSQSHWAFGDGNTSLTTNPNHTFNANGSHTIVLTTATDSSFSGPECVDYSMQTVNVSGIQSPLQCYAGFVIYADTGINNVTVVNSSAGTNLTYLWDFGDGTTSTLQNPSHTYATAGPFYLCLTVDDGNGCIDQYCDSIGANGVVFKTGGFTINVITPVVIGVDELNVIDVFSIYPNPTSTQLTIDTELELDRISIVDVTGKQIRSFVPKTKIFKVSDLSDGIYFIKIITEERIITKKFVKQ